MSRISRGATTKNPKRAARPRPDHDGPLPTDLGQDECASVDRDWARCESTKCFTNEDRAAPRRGTKRGSRLTVGQKGRRHVTAAMKKRGPLKTRPDPELEAVKRCLRLHDELAAMSPKMRQDARVLFKDDFGGLVLEDDVADAGDAAAAIHEKNGAPLGDNQAAENDKDIAQTCAGRGDPASENERDAQARTNKVPIEVEIDGGACARAAYEREARARLDGGLADHLLTIREGPPPGTVRTKGLSAAKEKPPHKDSKASSFDRSGERTPRRARSVEQRHADKVSAACAATSGCELRGPQSHIGSAMKAGSCAVWKEPAFESRW